MNRTRIAVLATIVAALAAGGATLPATASTAASGASNAAPVDRGYRPLHPDYPQVKAQADAMAQAKAGGSGNKPGHGGGGGGGGTPPSTINPDLGWAGVYQTNVTPPDSTGAAGPGYYIELVNDQYGIYSTVSPSTGAVTGSLSALFTATGVSNSVLSDPQILWDPETGHFYYVAIDTTSGNYALLYGFSKTADPRQGFCSYRAISYGSTLPDYPKLGDMAGYLLVGVNDFLNASSYTGSEVAYIAKAPTGDVAASCPALGNTGRIPLSQPATPVPAVQADTAGTGYVVQAADVSGSATTAGNALYVTSINPAGSTQATTVPMTVGPFYMPPSAPQYGTSRKLDTMDGRLERAVEAGGVIYTAHAVATSAGGRSVERWYAIAPSAAKPLAGGGDLSDPSLYVFNGAISPDLNSNLVMGVSTSGSNAYPAIQAVKWTVGSPTPVLGVATSSDPGTVIEQSQTYDSDFSCNGGSSVCRWGDYSGASPGYDSTGHGVYLSNEYSNGGGSIFQAAWRTRNVLITIP